MRRKDTTNRAGLIRHGARITSAGCQRGDRLGSRVESELQTSYSKEGGSARMGAMTTFGARLRELRRAKSLSQKRLADRVGVHFTYLSKVESEKLDFGLYPSEELIRRLAT